VAVVLVVIVIAGIGEMIGVLDTVVAGSGSVSTTQPPQSDFTLKCNNVVQSRVSPEITKVEIVTMVDIIIGFSFF